MRDSDRRGIGRVRQQAAWRSFSLLLLALHGPVTAQDCDGDLVSDAEEIALGQAEDCNENGVPDSCELEAVPYRVVRTFASSGNATGIHAADFDGDGFRDLAIGTTDNVSVRLRDPNAPDVSFTSSDYSLPGRSEAWVGGDLDGDRRDDLIASDGAELQILFNDGAGAFPVRVPISLSRGLEGLAIGDVDGDGQSDIVVGNRVERTILVLQNLGDRTFAEPQTLAVPASPSVVTVGDFDADGDGDIASDGASFGLVVVEHLENFRFSAPRRLDVIGEQAFGVVAADFTQDGAVELATVTRSGVALLAEAGGSRDALTTYALNGTPSALTAGDINADGDLDILASYLRPRGAWIFQNAGAGRLVSASPLELAFDLAPTHLSVNDLNLDGHGDLIVIAQFTASVVWNDGNEGGGQLVRLETVDDFEAGGRPHGGDIGDLDADGDMDLVMGHNGDGIVGGICLSLNHGDGTFAAAYGALPAVVSFTLAVVDVDGDGDLDVATSDSGRLVIARNSGNGTIERSDPVPQSANAFYLISTDVDADGDNDLVGASGGNLVDVYRNAGDGTFPERSSRRVGSGVHGVAAFDMEGDGDVDVAVAAFGSSELTFLRGDRAGNFEEALTLPVLGQPNFVFATDLDADGRRDAVTANRGGNVSLFWNLGDGRFAPGLHLDSERELYSLWTGDVTGDGRPEVVTLTEAGRSVSALVNRGDRTFSAPVRHQVGFGPRHVRVVNLDGDGDLDVLTINRGGSTFTVLRNSPSEIETVGFLPRICTVADFFSLSRGSGPVERVARFLLPAREGAALGPAFLNVSRFALHEEFFAATLPERFPEIPRGEALDRLVGRRATREYYAGTLTRRRGVDGFFYTFSIVADTELDPGEALRLEEVSEIYEQVSSVFRLTPLFYEPDTPAARAVAEVWPAPSFPIFFPEVREDGGGERPTFQVEVPPDSVLCGVFPKNAPGRAARDEYEAKGMLRLVAGTLSLPTTSASIEANLVEELVFGPERIQAQPAAPGGFRLVELQAGDETVHRFTYRQDFALPGGDVLTIQIFGLDFRSRAGVPVAESVALDDAFFTWTGSVEGLLNGSPRVAYSSCGYALLPGFEIDVTATDGTRLHLREQFLEVESEFDTGPAALVRAEVMVGGRTQTTDDYWRLVYAARRHNQDVRYWVLLDPPLDLAAAPDPVRAVEVLTPQPDDRPQPLLNYLDEGFQSQATVQITTFDKRAAPATLPRFRRGDVDGSGTVNLADAIVLLEYVFRNGEPSVCLNAGDADDDGRLNVVDAIRLLSAITRGRALPPPLECGVDPTSGDLPCAGTCQPAG